MSPVADRLASDELRLGTRDTAHRPDATRGLCGFPVRPGGWTHYSDMTVPDDSDHRPACASAQTKHTHSPGRQLHQPIRTMRCRHDAGSSSSLRILTGIRSAALASLRLERY